MERATMKRRRPPDALPGIIGMLLALLGNRYGTQLAAALPETITNASVTLLAGAAAGILLLSLLRRIVSGGVLAPRSRQRQRVGLALFLTYEGLWVAGGLLANLAARHLPHAFRPSAGLLVILVLTLGIPLVVGDVLIQRAPNTEATNRRNFLALLDARYGHRQYGVKRGATHLDSDITRVTDAVALGARVLIVREPGSHTSTRLFDLGLRLVRQARLDATLPLPVIFNLKAWTNKRLPLADWLIEDLAFTYQVPKRIARSWVGAAQVRPLLDGLDELPDRPTREDCVEVINAFLEAHPTLHLVVCSQLAVYRPQQMRLALRPVVRNPGTEGSALSSIGSVFARSPVGITWLRSLVLILAALLGSGVLVPPAFTLDPSTPIITRVATIESQDSTVPAWGLGANLVIRHGVSSLQNQVLLRNLQDLQLSTMRFPGGLAGAYDWKHGTFNLEFDGQPSLAAGWGYGSTVWNLAVVQRLYTQIHATPVYTLNMITSGPNSYRPCGSMSTWSADWQAMLDDQIAFLQSAQALGLPVKLVELGNEMYWQKCQFPTGGVYGTIATHWADALHAAFPGVRVALSGEPTGSGGLEGVSPTWNSDMLATAKDYDAVAMHLYAYEGIYVLGDTSDQCLTQRNALNRLLTRQGAANLFGNAYWWAEQNLSLLQTLPANVRVWVTEAAASDPAHGMSGTWAEGLFSAVFTTNLLTYRTVDMYQEQSAVDESLYGEIFDPDGYSGRHGCTIYPPPHDYEYSGKGFALQMLGRAVSGMSASAPIAFAPSLQLGGTGSRGVPAPAIMGRCYWNRTRETALLLNLSSQPQRVTTAFVRPPLQWGGFDQYSGYPALLATGDVSSTGGTYALKRTQGPVASGTVTLAPYSITLLWTR
jgi:hypothetical protein